MKRRLLLSVAGVSLLTASAGCGPAPDPAGDINAGATPEPPASPGPAAPPAPSPSPTPLNVASPSLAPPTRKPRLAAPPLFSLPSEDKLVALTLDDGPDPTHTPTVLKILHDYGIRATFFLVGENVSAHRSLVTDIAQQGHHIANHTWSHPDLRQLSATAVRDQLERTSDLLQELTGKPPTWFRAPGGDFSNNALSACADLGMRPMGWSVDPRDWARPGTAKITSRVLEEIGPGSIVLNHDGGGDRSQTVAALKTYLPVLLDGGYRFTAPR
ncbi:polysaccharide deacetylase family protein [Kitasatospora camelliae]|uniref:Polysaccharide deacetylase family protein n=1 Tax=Kitasatospora camelliae TaxID=3156397 RepID=A0AAU8JUG1_9ACTN